MESQAGQPIAPSQATERYTLLPFQKKAWEAIQSGENVLLSGPTGTGKSQMLRWATEFWRGEGQRCVWLLTQPYGDEAHDVFTFYSFLGIRDPIVRGEFVRQMPDVSRLAQTDCVCIDNLSWVPWPLAEMLFEAIEQVQAAGHYVHIIAAGDFLAAPPDLSVEQKLRYQTYYRRSIGRGYIFQMPQWRQFHFAVYHLDGFADSERLAYVKLLRRVRFGERKALDEILSTCSRTPVQRAVLVYHDRAQAASMHAQRMGRMNGEILCTPAIVLHDGHTVPANLPALEVKKNMTGFLMRDCVAKNGELYPRGAEVSVTDWSVDCIEVRPVGGQNRIALHRVRLQLDTGVYYYQFPLLPGMALYAHNAMWVALRRANIDGGVFGPGELYALLSRPVDATRFHFSGPLGADVLPIPLQGKFFDAMGFPLTSLYFAADRPRASFFDLLPTLSADGTQTHYQIVFRDGGRPPIRPTGAEAYLTPIAAPRELPGGLLQDPDRGYFITACLNAMLPEAEEPGQFVALTVEQALAYLAQFHAQCVDRDLVYLCAHTLYTFLTNLARDERLSEQRPFTLSELRDHRDRFYGQASIGA